MDDIATSGSDSSDVAGTGDLPSTAVTLNFPARARLKPEDIPALVEPIIARATKTLCKQHCRGARFRLICTVDATWSRAPRDASLCDRGNEAYEWMLRDLLGGAKLDKFLESDREGVAKYFTKTVSSQSFYERFKDMRFGERVRIPAYIKAIHPLARRVFWMLRKQETVPYIAQALEQPETIIRTWINDIYLKLREHRSSHLLQSQATLSLDALNENEDAPCRDLVTGEDLHHNLERQQEQARARAAYAQLSWQEQFIVDTLTENLSAKAVLEALAQEGIILEGINDTPMDEKCAEQRLYYLRRKALVRLKALFEKEVRQPSVGVTRVSEDICIQK